MMKFKLLMLIAATLSLNSVAHAQVKANGTVTLSGASTDVVTLTWTEPTSCPNTTAPCTYQVDGILGTCPATIVGSTGWTVVGTTATDVATYVDSSEVANTTGTPVQISYVIYTLSGGAQSLPSTSLR